MVLTGEEREVEVASRFDGRVTCIDIRTVRQVPRMSSLNPRNWLNDTHECLIDTMANLVGRKDRFSLNASSHGATKVGRETQEKRVSHPRGLGNHQVRCIRVGGALK